MHTTENKTQSITNSQIVPRSKPLTQSLKLKHNNTNDRFIRLALASQISLRKMIHYIVQISRNIQQFQEHQRGRPSPCTGGTRDPFSSPAHKSCNSYRPSQSLHHHISSSCFSSFSHPRHQLLPTWSKNIKMKTEKIPPKVRFKMLIHYKKRGGQSCAICR